MEPLSGLKVNVGSAFLADGDVMPSSGGYQMLLDMNVLTIEGQLVKAMKDFNAAVAGEQTVDVL